VQSDAGTLLIQASIDIAKSLVFVGLWLVVIGFVATLVAAFANAPEIKKAIDKVANRIVEKLPVKPQIAGETDNPAIPYGELFRGMFSAITDLIRTPVGVGMALIVLAVVLLISQAAIAGRFTESGSTEATQGPTSGPVASEEPPASPEASEAAPSSDTQPSASQ
jgi:uncharacterized membrane protein